MISSEGFDGFPKTLPEDCVEYSIYVIDAKLKDVEIRDKLRQVQNAASTLIKQILKDFIWQREPFGLTLQREVKRSFLSGRTNYGDSIDDEWLVVYILRRLSQSFPEIWIRVVDTDGQFLLIEAANALPIWLNPEIADSRVWINDGKLLIIPLEQPGGATRGIQGADNLTLDEAISWIADPQAVLQHSSKIEAEAFFRLQRYPQQIADSLHHALVNVPRKLAYALHSDAAYISPAVEAFYLRDPIALKPLQTMRLGSLRFPPKDLVKMSVTFTKVGYAQLKSQQFDAPPAWGDTLVKQGNAKAQDQAEMGMRLACGFEMMMSDPQNQDKQAVREIALILEDLDAEEVQLPSDDAVRRWGLRDDDDSWLDINYDDFENELAGKRQSKSTNKAASFGDKGAQNNLRKMVERFENFLKDDSAGIEGAEILDDMDNDDDEDDGSDETSTISDESNLVGGNTESDLNEDEFTTMMRELMGMPADVMKEMMSSGKTSVTRQRRDVDTAVRQNDEYPSASSSEVENEENIREAMQQTEQELCDAGVLDLETPTDPNKALSQKRVENAKPPIGAQPSASPTEPEDLHEHVGNADYHLAKNLLESFKSQAGVSGPSSNLMGIMGINRMPQDDAEGE